MKFLFPIALAVLLLVAGGLFYVAQKRASERQELERVSQLYKAREDALLKARMQAQEEQTVTKIVPATPEPVPR